MKQLVFLFALPFLISSFAASTMTDKFEVLYDSKPIPKEGIIWVNGKNIQVIKCIRR